MCTYVFGGCRMAAQKFGGPWSLEKLKIVQQYLKAFCTALGSRFNLVYIDAFAGSGEFSFLEASAAPLLDIDEVIRSASGSAHIALSCIPPFSNLHFIEQKKRNVLALEALKKDHPTRAVEVLKGDANDLIAEVCDKIDWRNSRGVLFIDPFGNSLDWTTLEHVAQNTKLDVWYLFPLSGLFRQAPIAHNRLTEDKRASITRLLGTGEWEEYFYKVSPKSSQPMLGETQDFFPNEEEIMIRAATVDGILNYVSQRLRTIFPFVTEPRVLRGPSNAPLYALYLALSNDSKPARALATRLTDHLR